MTAYAFGGYVAVCCDGTECRNAVRVAGTESVRRARRDATAKGYRYLEGRDWCPSHEPAPASPTEGNDRG
jgi:hypothetical protein